MSVTQAMRFLQQQKIPYELREYDYRIKGADIAAEALDWPRDAMVKTLVTALDREFALCLLPATAELSLKKLARLAGVKTARMSTEEEAEKATGYLVGGISPFGTRKKMAVWMHEPILSFETIGINGGRRGAIVFLDPKRVRDALGAKAADLAA
jgi:Cys-tRNA(Pro)/Cys-tRNA(Cys) deacylase